MRLTVTVRPFLADIDLITGGAGGETSQAAPAQQR